MQTYTWPPVFFFSILTSPLRPHLPSLYQHVFQLREWKENCTKKRPRGTRQRGSSCSVRHHLLRHGEACPLALNFYYYSAGPGTKRVCMGRMKPTGHMHVKASRGALLAGGSLSGEGSSRRSPCTITRWNWGQCCFLLQSLRALPPSQVPAPRLGKTVFLACAQPHILLEREALPGGEGTEPAAPRRLQNLRHPEALQAILGAVGRFMVAELSPELIRPQTQQSFRDED